MKKIAALFVSILTLSYAFGVIAQEAKQAPPAEAAVRGLGVQEETEKEKAARIAAEEESKELLDEGKQLMKDGDTEGAIELFKAAIEKDVNNAIAHRNLGIACSWIGDNENAINAFKNLVSIAPDNADGYRHLVLICNMEGLNKEAIKYGEKAMEINPEDFAVMGYLASNYIVAGEYPKASGLCRRLIEHNPKSARAYRMQAMCYLGMDMEDEAKESYKKSHSIIRRESADSSAREKTENWKTLFKELQAEVLFLSGNRYIENADQTSSIRAYEQSIELNPDDFRPYYNLAKIYERIKEKPTAVKYLKEAVRLNPTILNQITASDEFDSLKGLDEFKEMLPEEGAEGKGAE